jgi:C4-dicarboxylate-specific signal transduction histidine kinase
MRSDRAVEWQPARLAEAPPLLEFEPRRRDRAGWCLLRFVAAARHVPTRQLLLPSRGEAEVARALLRDFISKRRTEVETAAHRLTSWMGSLMHGHKTTTSDAEAAAAATKVQAAMRGQSIRSARENWAADPLGNDP